MRAAHHVFIGHDGREPEATLVCEKSLRRHFSEPLSVQYLIEPALRHIGLYTRPWRAEGVQKIDGIDGKPFSTAFSFTRFLVPSLMQHQGVALFCDADFLFLDDAVALFACFDPRFAVQVVKHDYSPPPGLKMDGQAQQPYWRKNWSSLILWNCGHPSNQRLTPREVNSASGQWLHGFSWLDDDEIGTLPAAWNWLSGVDPVPTDLPWPHAVHFTLGIPSMPGHEDSPMADLWREERAM